MADFTLSFIFSLTGSRAVSEMISERRQARRWAATVAKHKAAGGVVCTMSHAGGEASYLLGGE